MYINIGWGTLTVPMSRKKFQFTFQLDILTGTNLANVKCIYKFPPLMSNSKNKEHGSQNGDTNRAASLCCPYWCAFQPLKFGHLTNQDAFS